MKIWNSLKNLLVFALIAWVAWYAYSQWDSAPAAVRDNPQSAEFNCRKALARLADDYACRDSAACVMEDDELNDLKHLEAEIDRHCN